VVGVTVEWGKAAFAILVIVAGQLYFYLFRGAISRGRDPFFAAAACAGTLVALCQSFVDASLMTPGVQLVLAVLIGLGLSQSPGRTSSV
jgi:hypothetical protein